MKIALLVFCCLLLGFARSPVQESPVRPTQAWVKPTGDTLCQPATQNAEARKVEIRQQFKALGIKVNDISVVDSGLNIAQACGISTGTYFKVVLDKSDEAAALKLGFTPER